MKQTSPARAVLFYALVGTPVAVLVFLLASQFFSAWHGQAVGMQPLQATDPSFYRVLVVQPDGSERTLDWATEVVEGLEIPLTGVLAPPPTIPETSPLTTKARFSLHYVVASPEGSTKVVPTTSPTALALAALVWMVGLLLRNMVVAGSPLAFEAQPTKLPRALPPAGQVATRKTKSKKGPPPQRRGKKR